MARVRRLGASGGGGGGVLLEARVQRLFLAQSSFAERGLIPAATSDRRMLATDIDVLVSEYVSGFHLTKRHIECKSGKFALLDRIIWLRGVRAMLGADSSYLMATEVDRDAQAFARSLGIEIFSGGELDAWEKSASVDPDVWPGRSDFGVYDVARKIWNKKATAQSPDDEWRWIRRGMLFIEVESWSQMRYRHLNKALRLLEETAQRHPKLKADPEKGLAIRYLFSALLVRLAQYTMFVCGDILPVPRSEREEYLGSRLAFGDQDPERAASLVASTVKWVGNALAAKGLTLPPEIDLARLKTAPPYTREFASLIDEVLSHSAEARHMVLATEREQFGSTAEDNLTRLRAAVNSGRSLAAHVKGFVLRAFSVPNGLGNPLHGDLASAYGPASSRQRALPVAKNEPTPTKA